MVEIGAGFPPRAPQTEVVVQIPQRGIEPPVGHKPSEAGVSLRRWKKASRRKMDRKNREMRREMAEMREKLEAERKRLEEKEMMFQMRYQMTNCFFQGFIYSQ